MDLDIIPPTKNTKEYIILSIVSKVSPFENWNTAIARDTIQNTKNNTAILGFIVVFRCFVLFILETDK